MVFLLAALLSVEAVPATSGRKNRHFTSLEAGDLADDCLHCGLIFRPGRPVLDGD